MNVDDKLNKWKILHCFDSTTCYSHILRWLHAMRNPKHWKAGATLNMFKRNDENNKPNQCQQLHGDIFGIRLAQWLYIWFSTIELWELGELNISSFFLCKTLNLFHMSIILCTLRLDVRVILKLCLLGKHLIKLYWLFYCLIYLYWSPSYQLYEQALHVQYYFGLDSFFKYFWFQ